MRIQRSIVHLTAIAVAMALPACAGAEAGSPLLSGYGGPGSGSQAILGSGLVNIGGGGGGAAAGGGVVSAAQGSGSSTPLPSQGGSKGIAGTGSRTTHGSSGSRSSDAGSRATGASPTVVIVTGANSQNLVLPSGEIVEIVLALIILALTAALTVVLARRSADDAS